MILIIVFSRELERSEESVNDNGSIQGNNFRAGETINKW